jgi:endoglucanase
MKKIVLLLSAAIIIIALGCTKLKFRGNKEGGEDLSKYSLRVAATTFPFGVNLQGGEYNPTQPPNYGTNYVYPGATQLNYYQSKGLMLIRLPFRWERAQPLINGPLDTTEVNRILTVVDLCNARGMKVLLDAHNGGGRFIPGNTTNSYKIGTTQVPKSAFTDFWTKMADFFKTRPNIWGYGLSNEPVNMLPAPNSWFDIAQEAINGIRTTDPNTAIVIGGDSWSFAGHFGVPGSTSDVLKNLVDPSNNLIYEAHIYFDNDHSGFYDTTYDVEGAYATKGIDWAKPFVDWCEANNKVGFFGEYGVPGNDPRWLVVLDNFLRYIQDHNINGTYWSGGQWSSNDPLSVEPIGGVDKPQMQVLLNYLDNTPDPGTVADADFNKYHTVTIGAQTWMAENLKTTRFRDGTAIPNVTANGTWSTLTTPAYSWYNNDIANKLAYGALYNWHAVNDAHKLAPAGWHVPTDAERAALDTYLGGASVAGGPLKETGTVHWTSPNTGATNASGFKAVGAGYRISGTGIFSSMGTQNYIWTSTPDASTNAYRKQIQYNTVSTPVGLSDKKSGFSVRLIKDAPYTTTVTDIDGNLYHAVTIGSLVWTVENLKVTRYRNGDSIANVTADNSWKSLTTGAYCWFNNDIANKAVYGALYNFYAVADTRNLAPAGWHIATEAENATIDSLYGGTGMSGASLKESGTAHWTAPNYGSNTTGFTGVGTGYRTSNTGVFTNFGIHCFIWTSTTNGATGALRRQLINNSYTSQTAASDKKSGFSVRLVRD